LVRFFAIPIAVTVKDAGNNLLQGVNVTFTAPSTGASGQFSNGSATMTAASDIAGTASVSFTANTVAGANYAVTAGAGTLSATFTLTNLPGSPASITPNAGSTPQSTPITSAFANRAGRHGEGLRQQSIAGSERYIYRAFGGRERGV